MTTKSHHQGDLPWQHIKHQWPVIRTIGQAMTSGLKSKDQSAPTFPMAEITETIPPRPRSLVHDFIRHVGGNPEAYAGQVPFHMFPQWSIPIGFRGTAHLPFDFKKIINLGVKAQINGMLRQEEPLLLRSQILGITDTGKRAFVTTRFVSETATVPEALVCEFKAMLPSRGLPSYMAPPSAATPTKAGQRPKLSRLRVPYDSEALGTLTVSKTAGLSFAMLTGDFNPLHWLAPYARMIGFATPILHGYASMSYAIEMIIRERFAGDPAGIKSLQVDFANPLPLPAKVGLYWQPDGRFYLGAAQGGKAFLVGAVNQPTDLTPTSTQQKENLP